MISPWPAASLALVDEGAERDMEVLQEIVSEIRPSVTIIRSLPASAST